MKFAVLSYQTPNIGDDIQSLASRQHLPRVDTLVERDEISNFKPEENGQYAMLLNGWFMQQPQNWPPSDRISPLFISFHIDKYSKKQMLAPASLEYFRKHEPIGCRDHATAALLESNGVKSYYSGCLTLTLEKPDVPAERNGFVVCDPFGHDDKYKFFLRGHPQHQKLLKVLDPKNQLESAEHVTHEIAPDIPQEERLTLAQDLLKKYASASLVITSRIHCALPCLAFGTPVLFIEPRKASDYFYGGLVGKVRDFMQRIRFRDPRYSGIVNHMHSIKVLSLEKGISPEYDFLNPLSNPDKIEDLKERLRTNCREFLSTSPDRQKTE